LTEDVEIAEERLGDRGRVLLRASGTEPVIRVMVEAPTHEEAAEIAGHLAADTILVLEEDGAVTGCVLAKVHGARGYFGLLSVDPARQGGGRARRLIEAAEAHCRDAGCTVMDINVVNLRDELPAFYRRFGYVETGVEAWPGDATSRLKRPAHFIRFAKAL
jgi:GNAT superfamily N-acetyltransferase